LKFLFFFFSLTASLCFAASDEGLWHQGFSIPENGRSNPYQLSQPELGAYINAGKIHAQIYPVEITGVLPPINPVKALIESEPSDPLRKIIQDLLQGFSGITSVNQVFKMMGMHPYPLETDQGIYSVPYPNGVRPDYPMGFGTLERNGNLGFVISCAECHSSRLFGKTVLGLTNRFPKANKTFVTVKSLMKHIDTGLVQKYTNATDGERDLLLKTKRNFRAIGVKEPIVLGLDTSLAQVALSLSRRNIDDYATKSKYFEKHPRENLLEDFPADSKPAVWWNLKYKNRFLSDGSVSNGNPIFTNILWNEIGRGTDLQELESWLHENAKTIQEITAAVFSIEAPKITDFFPPDLINIEKAKQGERLFVQSCSRCHGNYEKAWSSPNALLLSKADLLKTITVRYPSQTFSVDVGTDPNRYLGMSALLPLNDLKISKASGTIITLRKGYVPPPLVGIWARWPYFHNNSVPSLCAVLTKASERPSKYYSGNANDPATDFDFNCNGYPTGKQTPEAWRKSEFLYKTEREGMHNSGHDEGIFLKNGQELFSPEQKTALIQFLQTL
jgi:mono/diheme cytochrome c family protein